MAGNPRDVPAESKPKAKARRERVRARRRVRRNTGLLAGIAIAAIAAALFIANLGRPPLNTALHQHPHIEIFINGEAVLIPTDIGIDPALWNDHTLDEFQEMASMSPLHTHDSSGVIHLELKRWHACTLGDFFSVWGQAFDQGHLMSYVGPVTVTVGGAANSQYRALVLQDGQQIVVRGG